MKKIEIKCKIGNRIITKVKIPKMEIINNELSINDNGLIDKISLGKSMFKKNQHNMFVNLFLKRNIRKQHLMVIGLKGSLKTTVVLPSLVNQDFLTNSASVIIMMPDKEKAKELYVYHKQFRKRKKIYYYEDRNDICNLQDNIQHFSTTIITGDMFEALKNKEYDRIDLDGFINEVSNNEVSIYIDDAKDVLDMVIKLIGKQNNQIALTLFFQSRADFAKYENLINNNVLNTLLLNLLNRDDISYYEKYAHYKNHFIDYGFVMESHVELLKISNKIANLKTKLKQEFDNSLSSEEFNKMENNILKLEKDRYLMIKDIIEYDNNHFSIYSRKKHINVIEYVLEDGTRELTLSNFYDIIENAQFMSNDVMKKKVSDVSKKIKKDKELILAEIIKEEDLIDINKQLKRLVRENRQYKKIII